MNCYGTFLILRYGFGWLNIQVDLKNKLSGSHHYTTVDSRYLVAQGTFWSSSRYPYLDYQIFRIKQKMNQTTTFHKWICNLTPEVTDILKILWKRGEIALYSTIFFHLLLDFHVKTGTKFLLRDKRLFEISKVEITRVDCTFFFMM